MANLQKQRTAIVAEMRAILAIADAGNRSLTSKETDRFDTLDREIETIDAKLGDKDSSIESFRAAMRQTKQPQMLDIGGPNADPAETWADRDGNKVTVLSKGQSLASAVRERGEESSPYNLGHVVQQLAGVRLPADVRAAMSEGSNTDGGYLVNPGPVCGNH